ncbi:MAG TPA: hypothetical protein VMV70_05785 [Gallionella sp.]|nr:hypothetical protein [Gallionella sp.]
MNSKRQHSTPPPESPSLDDGRARVVLKTELCGERMLEVLGGDSLSQVC